MFLKCFETQSIPFQPSNSQFLSFSLFLSFPLSVYLSPSSMVSEIGLNKLHASAMAAKSLISYTCLITVVGSHFLFHMQPSRVEQASVSSEHGPNSHLIKTVQK